MRLSDCLIKLKQNVQSREELNILLLQLRCHISDIDHITYAGLNIPGSGKDHIVFTTYSEDWGDHYFKQKYKYLDPVINYGFQSLLPLDWALLPRNTNPIEAFFGEAREFGISSTGISVPIRGMYGESCLFSINTDVGSQEWQAFKQSIIGDLTYCAFLFHDLVLSQFLPRSLLLSVKLSPREIEILKWAALGKTSYEMAKILNLSKRTIDAYFSNVHAKLGVVNRTQAVVRATQLGLLPR